MKNSEESADQISRGKRDAALSAGSAMILVGGAGVVSGGEYLVLGAPTFVAGLLLVTYAIWGLLR